MSYLKNIFIIYYLDVQVNEVSSWDTVTTKRRNFPLAAEAHTFLTLGNLLESINFDKEFLITLLSNVRFCYYLVQLRPSHTCNIFMQHVLYNKRNVSCNKNYFIKMFHATTICVTNMFHAIQNISWNLFQQ